MRSNYKALGPYIREVDIRDADGKVDLLLGVSIQKKFMPSIANTIGTDMSTYKIIKRNQFAYGPVTSRNADKISIALLEDYDEAIVSQAYVTFEVAKLDELIPAYLMMWFRRPEFDRYARYMSHGSAREIFSWEEMCNTMLPIPSLSKQQEIVAEYNTIRGRLKLNEHLIQKLEETAQSTYKQWFLDYEFPNQNGEPYKTAGGEMVWNEELKKEIPKGWDFDSISNYMDINSGFAFKSGWWTRSGLPVIKIGTIQNNTIDESQLEFISESRSFNKDNYRVNKGDIVLAMTGFTMGKIGLVPGYLPTFYVNQRVGFFKMGNSNYHKAGYLYCTLSSQFFQNQIWSFGGDSQQFNVSADQISSIKVLLPNKALIESFNIRTEPMFERIIVAHSSNRSLTKLKDLLLSKMATIQT